MTVYDSVASTNNNKNENNNTGGNKMRINIHAGHNPANKVACGAIGLLNESTENRNVVKELKTNISSIITAIAAMLI